ncbi:hypothetical protein [Ideonella margarita]|jgi:hypothetical protein|uniref:Exonuclease n=1 Tax=Ideonella margarita TaxID=2984191 RepID=A0ABU9C9E1_9BURK
MTPTSAPPGPAAPPPAMADLPGVIDVEASGFGRGSYPIEVGFVLPDGATVCTLVKPPPHWTHWDGQAESLHGLTRELLDQHGRAPRDVAVLLNQHLAGTVIYCDSWAHDYAWLAVLFEEAGMAPAFRLRHLHELLSDADAAEWDQACADARVALSVGRHRASTDARVLQLALGRLRQRRRVEAS